MSLELEYKQWLFITVDLYNVIYKELSVKSAMLQQEARNIFQHWILMLNQDQNIERYQYYSLLPKMNFEDNLEITNKLGLSLVDAVHEKKFFWSYGQAMGAVGRILRYIDESHKNFNFEGLNLAPRVEEGLIHLDQFECKHFVNLPYLLKHFSLVDVTKMVLRYESIGNGSYQWGDPKELHICYYDDYCVRYEGFASPFNSRFIGMPDSRFCSLFPDTDEVFGSLGNFFDVDLSQHRGAWSVNPPFINDVMERVSQKIINAIDSGVKSTFFCTYPYWKDSPGWILLEKSKYLVEAFHREKHIVIQDAYGRVFAPFNGLSLFCISFYTQLNLNNVSDILNKGLDEIDTSYNLVIDQFNN